MTKAPGWSDPERLLGNELIEQIVTVPPSDTNILRGASGKYLVAPGDVFGRLTVLGEIVGKGYIRCRCICGLEIETARHAVVHGRTRSCGCLAREVRAANGRKYAHTKLHPALMARHEAAFRYYDNAVTKHVFAGAVLADLSAHRALYAMDWGKKHNILWKRLANDPTVPPMLQQLAKTYAGMFTRTKMKKGRDFDYYVGRGIGMWPGWHGNDGFWRWATFMVMEVGEWPGPGWSLDRIDNDRGYEPGNLRWANRKTQQRNTRRAIIITFQGRKMSVHDAADLCGASGKLARQRLRHGWPESEIFAPPFEGWRKTGERRR